MPADPEFVKLRNRLTTARREIRKAVERTGKETDRGVEFRRGHMMEAARECRRIIAACDDLEAALRERS
jgi:hypothetical protein